MDAQHTTPKLGGLNQQQPVSIALASENWGDSVVPLGWWPGLYASGGFILCNILKGSFRAAWLEPSGEFAFGGMFQMVHSHACPFCHRQLAESQTSPDGREENQTPFTLGSPCRELRPAWASPHS